MVVTKRSWKWIDAYERYRKRFGVKKSKELADKFCGKRKRKRDSAWDSWIV